MRPLAKVFVALIGICLIPERYLASPDWTITVQDEKGEPQSNATVRLVYKNYSVENTSHEEDQLSDNDGRVHFPVHKRWTFVFDRLFYTALSANAFVHASFGRHAYAFAFGQKGEGNIVAYGYVYDWTGEPSHLESTIVLHKSNN